MKSKLGLSIAILAISTMLFSCGPSYQPQVVYQQPQVVQPMQASQPGYYDQSYQTYVGPNGGQYAVTVIDGVAQYIAMATFMNWMNSGGYDAVYYQYHHSPSYFHPYTSNPRWTASGTPVTYGSYMTSHHITINKTYVSDNSKYNGYKTASVTVQPKPQPTQSNTSGFASTRQQTAAPQTNTSGFGSTRQVATPTPQPNTSGFSSRRTQAPAPQANSSGFGSTRTPSAPASSPSSTRSSFGGSTRSSSSSSFGGSRRH